jgi:hypothetical protein
LPIHVVQVDVLATVPTAHHVIHCSRILDPHLPRHGATVPAGVANRQDEFRIEVEA